MTPTPTPTRRTGWIFAALFLGYFAYTLMRRPLVQASEALRLEQNFTHADVGAALSAFSVGYGSAKFAAGLFIDVVPLRPMFCGGLLISAIVCALTAQARTPGMLALAWGVHGFTQGLGWPSLAKILLQVFPPRLRGKVWSLLTMSSNLALTTAPLVLTAIRAAAPSWQWVFYAPAGASAVLAVFAGVVLLQTDMTPSTTPSATHAGPGGPPNAWRAALVSPRLWALVGADALANFVGKAFSDWGLAWLTLLYAVPAAAAAGVLAAHEAGGMCGAMTVGWLSDWLGGVGFRSRASLVQGLVLVVPLGVLLVVPAAVSPLVALVLFALAGFAIHGPKTMLGIAVREDFESTMGPATAVLGLGGQVGSALAGRPLGTLIDTAGPGAIWQLPLTVLLAWLACCGLLACVSGPARPTWAPTPLSLKRI